MTNTITGSPRTAVQVRNVQGNVHFHQPNSAPPVPRQLPARRLFVDRERITTYLDHAWAVRHGPLWVGVEGPSGVGKTALAVEWANRYTWPDGCLYADLTRTGPDSALRGWLGALGHQYLPDDPVQVEAFWRTATATQNLFVLLDNAQVSDAARLLPAGPDCAGIVTAHTGAFRLISHGGRCIRLPPLAFDATATLIHGLLDKPPPTPVMEAAVATTGGLPLSATLTAAYLSEHTNPRFTPQEEPVTAHVDRLLDALPDTTARAAIYLAIHPGYLTLPCVAALLDVVPEEARRVLTTLTEAGILQRSDEGRWTVHDQVRPTLAQLSTADERAQAVDRLAAYYRLRAAAAEDHLNRWRYRIDTEAADLARSAQDEQGQVWFSTTEEALAWCDSELSNLLPVTEMLADLERFEAWAMGDLLGTFLNKRRPLEISRPLFAASLRAAQEQECPAAAGLIHRRLAVVAETPEGKLEHSHAALAAFEEAKHGPGIATGHEGLGDAYLNLGDLDRAIRHLRESVRLHEQRGHRRGLSIQLRKLAEGLSAQGTHGQALELVVRAHRTQAGLEVPDRYQMARSASALIEVSLAHAAEDDRVLTVGERSALLMIAQTGVAQMSEDGALHRQAQMHEKVATLTTDPEHERTELHAALALHEQLGHPDASRVRSQLDVLSS